MKLISYHIENYGKLQNQDGVFEDGVTCFCEKNGFGKTTLASFVKAMFYGLDSYTGRSNAIKDLAMKIPERKHFYPFAGGLFGGNITFEKDGKIYKIERFFDESSEKKDALAVYCNNSLTTEFGTEIGRAVFGLDEEAFCKTVFITSDEVNISSTHSINEKLNRAVETADGEKDYEQTHKALEDAKKKVKSTRVGLYFDTKKRIDEIKTDIHNLESIQSALQEKYKIRQALCAQEEKLAKEYETARGRETVLAHWKRYDDERARIADLAARYESRLQEYPNGIPGADERKTLSDCLQGESALKGSLSSSAMSAEQSYRLQALQEKFRQGAPSEGLLAENGDKLQKITALETELVGLQRTQKSKDEERLESKFKHDPPTAEMLAATQALLEEYKDKKTEHEGLTSALLQGQAAQETPKKKTNFGAVLLSIAAVICSLGVGLVFVQKIVGIVLICIGGAGVVAGIILALAGGKSTSAPAKPNTQMSTEAVRLKAKIDRLEGQLKERLIPYGYYSGNPEVDFRELQRDCKLYTQSVSGAEARQAEIAKKTAKKKDLEEEVRAFLQSYGAETGNLQAGMNGLRKEIAEYASLRQTQRAAESRKTQAESELDGLRLLKKQILEKYALSEADATAEGIDKMAAASRDIARLCEEIEKGKAQAEAFRKAQNLTNRPEGDLPDVAEISAALAQTRRELTVCDDQIADGENRVEKLGDLKNRLNEEEELLAHYEERNNILEKALKSLEKAEQNLKDKYVKPIQDKFAFYAEAIEQVLNEKVTMDKDYRITFEKNGKNRDERHLSAGERSICALCLRLALIDNMYETEQPFIVMDDPFVHLDKEHMEKTAELVKKLSVNRQILYFCCHESREIQ